MTLRTLAAAILVAATPAASAADAYSIKIADKSTPPPDVQEPIAKLLAHRCVQLVNAKGELLVELWLRKEAPAKATEAQLSSGLTYRQLPETTLVGVVRLARSFSD